MSVRLEPRTRIVVSVDGTTIVDTARGHAVFETGLPPRYYVPRDDVRAELAPGTGQGTCPWKGKWTHLDVVVGARRIGNGAWSYHAPTPACEPIRDFVAFYDDKLRVEAT